jgi:hypothetical protein
MPIEIEHRWLVKALPPLVDAGASIQQGYLAVDADRTEVRLPSKAGKYYLTTNRGDGLVRSELECPSSRDHRCRARPQPVRDPLRPYRERELRALRYCVERGGSGW